jgi:hypothetical protein
MSPPIVAKCRVASTAPPHPRLRNAAWRLAHRTPSHAPGLKCRVAASAPRGGVNNVASGKAGRAAATRGARIPPLPALRVAVRIKNRVIPPISPIALIAPISPILTYVNSHHLQF